jgi:hypothetical protein
MSRYSECNFPVVRWRQSALAIVERTARVAGSLTAMNATICQAIKERRLLELRYHEHTRTVAPHVYGLDTTGDELLSGYQVWGGSEGGEAAGWKSFKVREIENVQLTTRKFGPRPEYRHGDRALAEIYCQV